MNCYCDHCETEWTSAGDEESCAVCGNTDIVRLSGGNSFSDSTGEIFIGDLEEFDELGQY